jgi:hypothetical protein
MVHLRTVPDAWHAKVLAARLGCEGIVTHLQGNLAGPYPFGAVTVMVEAGQAELAAALLLADEVESAFGGPTGCAPATRGLPGSPPPAPRSATPGGALYPGTPSQQEPAGGPPGDTAVPELFADVPWLEGTEPPTVDFGRSRLSPARWRRALAAVAALILAGGPLLAHFFA